MEYKHFFFSYFNLRIKAVKITVIIICLHFIFTQLYCKAGNNVNPERFIIQRINERTNTDRYGRRIESGYNKLSKIVSKKYNIVELPSTFESTFCSSQDLQELKSLIPVNDFYKNRTGLKIDTSEFHLYIYNNYFFAASEAVDIASIDHRFKETMFTTYWYYNITNINKEYIKNFRDFIQNINLTFIQLDKFISECIRIYDIADGYEYMGMSAIDAVNSIIQESLSGVTVNELIDKFVGLQSDVRGVQSSLDQIDDDLQKIQAELSEMNYTTFERGEAKESLEKFYQISNEIHILSKKLTSLHEAVSTVSEKYSGLSAVKQILFIKSAGDLFFYFEYLLKNINQESVFFKTQFHDFADNIDKNSGELYHNSFLFYSKYMNEMYAYKFPEMVPVRNIEKNMASKWPKHYNSNYFIHYLCNLDDSIKYSMSSDLLLFKHLTDNLEDTLNYFPEEATLFLLRKTLQYIRKKQIIGGVDVEEIIPAYKEIILNFNSNDRGKYYKELENITFEVARYYRREKRINALIYAVAGLIVVVIIFNFIRRKYRWKQYIS